MTAEYPAGYKPMTAKSAMGSNVGLFLTFHEWKSKFVKQESQSVGAMVLRSKSWYHTEYGKYCNRVRKNLQNVSKGE